MKFAMQRVLLPLLVVTAQAAFRAVNVQGKERITPELEPKSDKKFFGKDYPWDKRPVADKYYVFDHPYPAVQDSNDFDKDYIKDENSDGGRWKAQMDYDILRSKIRAEQDKLKKLKEKMEKEYEEWMRSKDDAKSGEEKAHEADHASDDAQKAADAAAKKVNDLEGRSGKDGTKVGGAIGDAIKKVNDEMDDLEKCKKALEEAKKRLKKLLKEKEEYEKKKKQYDEAKKAAEEASEKEKHAAAEKEEESKRKLEEKEEEEKAKKGKHVPDDESTWDEEAWRKKLDAEKKDHAEALANYEKELMDVKKTEDELARAAAELRKFRRPPHVDDNGGVYYEPESYAFSARAPAALLLAVFAAIFLA